MRLWFSTAVLLLCAGCATQAQQQAQFIRTNNQAAVSNLRACQDAVYNSPDYDPIRRHFPTWGASFSLEQLTDTAVPTDVEVKAIYATHPKMVACRQQELDQLTQSTPTFVPVLAAGWSHMEDNLVVLVQKKETWGEYSNQAKRVGDQIRIDLAAEGRRVDDGLERSHEAEMARRQAAAAAFSQYMQTQQAINAMSRPVVTNCNSTGNAMGSSTTCVSR